MKEKKRALTGIMRGQGLAIALEFYLPLMQEEDCERRCGATLHRATSWRIACRRTLSQNSEVFQLHFGASKH